MKTLWNSCKAAFAMFSRVPVPPVDWTPENQRYMFCFFPWVGVVIGGLEILMSLAGQHFFGEAFLTGVLMTLIPVLITGGIHLDGLMDTSDAISSYGDREKRLKILKDPHAGSFAVIACCCWFAVMAASCTRFCMRQKEMMIFALVFAESRCLSGTGVMTLPRANPEGTVAAFASSAEKKRVLPVLGVYMVLILAGMFLLGGIRGAIVFAVPCLVFLVCRGSFIRTFGGISGDLSGFYVCAAEAASALILAFLY